MIRTPTFPLLFCLAACGAWPDLPEPVGQRDGGSWPELLPLSELVAPAPDGAVGETDAARLAARAAALQERASLLRAPVDDADDFEALRARIAG
jgi:hypothetical protein